MERLDFETILNRTMILIEHFHRMTFCLQVYESQSIFGFRHGKPKVSWFRFHVKRARG